MLRQDGLADVGLHGGRGGDGGAVGPHDLPAEGLLLVADLHHVDLAVQPQVGAGHGEGGAPLAGAGLGGDALEALLLGVVGLGDGAVQLVGAGGVVALKLVVDFGRGLELLFQAVGPDQGRGAVHLVEVPDLLGNGDIGGVVVQLLLDEFITEYGTQVVEAHGGSGAGIQQGRGLGLHIGPDVVPGFRHLVFGEIDFVGDVVLFSCHDNCSFHACGSGKTKKTFVPQGPISNRFLWDKSLKTSAVPPKLTLPRPLGDVPSHAFPW